MALKTKIERKTHGRAQFVYGYVYEEETPEESELIYKINQTKKIIEFFPRRSQSFFIDKIRLEGFSSLPDPFNDKGNLRGGTLYYLNVNFKDLRVKNITVLKNGPSQVNKRGKALYLKFNLNLLKSISNELGSMRYFHNEEKATQVRKTLNQEFPDIIPIKEVKNPQYKVKHALRILDIQKPDTFTKSDIETVVTILEKLLQSKYKDQIKRSQLFTTAKLKVDEVTLNEVLRQFENKMQNKETTESDWGKFLGKNLFLIDTKYIHLIPELNLVLASSRKVDFGLVDIHSYLDIFEIKKPTTRLLSQEKDHGNYVWHADSVKAIVQAEKYLFNAERKAAVLKEDIKTEKNVELDVIRPRAYVIIGSSNQLDTDEKKNDFRILRNQFRNIEIVLYDELLERLRNQKKRAA